MTLHNDSESLETLIDGHDTQYAELLPVEQCDPAEGARNTAVPVATTDTDLTLSQASRAKTRWSVEDYYILDEDVAFGMTLEQIAADLSRSPGAVQRKITERGLRLSSSEATTSGSMPPVVVEREISRLVVPPWCNGSFDAPYTTAKTSEESDIISSLITGRHPFDDSPLPDGHICLDPRVKRALYLFSYNVEKTWMERFGAPHRSGTPWESGEMEGIVRDMARGTSMEEIVFIYGRTEAAIRLRFSRGESTLEEAVEDWRDRFGMGINSSAST